MIYVEIISEDRELECQNFKIDDRSNAMYVLIQDNGEYIWEKWYFQRKTYRKARHLKSARRLINQVRQKLPEFEGSITFK